jgi:hypothetical protein
MSYDIQARLERMSRNFKESVESSTDWLTVDSLVAAGALPRGTAEEVLNHWIRSGLVFSYASAEGEIRLPRYALDANYRPLRVVKTVLVALQLQDGSRIAGWFMSPTRTLGANAPKDLLGTDPFAVVEAAIRYGSVIEA